MEIQWEIDPEIEDFSILIRASHPSKELIQLLEYLESYKKQNDILLIKTTDDIFLLEQSKIECCEVKDTTTQIYTAQEQYTTKDRLYKILEQLNGDFIQCSKSSIINTRALAQLRTSFSGNMVAVLNSGRKVEITRKYLPKLKEKLSF